MRKQRSTKRALLLSALSLLMCVSMLIGSTFAWFTDSITSGSNKIQAGNLAVDLELYNKETDQWKSVKKNNDPIFTYTNWEPGYVDAKLLKVENEGSLALKWKAAFNTAAPLGILADVIDVFVKPGVTEAEFEALTRADLSGWTNAGTVRQFVGGIEESTYGTLEAKKSATLGIALKMREEAGNEYKNETLGAFDIMILATQLTSEKDSFNDQYDKDAPFPQGMPLTLSDTVDEITTVVKVPDEAPEGNYTLDVPTITYGNDKGTTTMSLDIDLKRNGEPVTNDGVPFEVIIQLPHPFVNMDNFQVLHNGQPVEGATYNKDDNSITFTTNGFSPFEIRYTDYIDSSFELDYQVDDAGNYTITKGMFAGKNPADFDTSLKSNDSEYIVVDYEKDDTVYYVVSKRATSVFVSADATASYGAFSAENVDFRSNMNGKLFELFNKDKPNTIYYNDHTTVFLLPGTFTEGTTINIGSSVDVIGLGDTNEVKVIKAAGASSSNRHLFNCSNASKADYAEVTLRNMYLDASEKTSNNKDNVSVQCIRKTKVKCYDLTINEGTWEYAFTVNANNAHDDGTKYPAYMYAENCNVIGTMVVDFSRKNTESFYYNNVTYKNGASTYSANDTRSKNIAMAANDWIWD